MKVDGKNYLLPADADIPDERRVATRAVALDEVMTAMDAASARASIIVIDACRDNPLPAGADRNLARGLSVVGMKPKTPSSSTRRRREAKHSMASSPRSWPVRSCKKGERSIK